MVHFPMGKVTAWSEYEGVSPNNDDGGDRTGFGTRLDVFPGDIVAKREENIPLFQGVVFGFDKLIPRAFV